jgi:hypothetical protein
MNWSLTDGERDVSEVIRKLKSRVLIGIFVSKKIES